jgi:hypothetical protein
MIKTLITGTFALVFSFFLVTGIVSAQTATPSPSKTVTTTPSPTPSGTNTPGAPQTGFGH